MADIQIKRGNRSPSVTATLRENGVAINLTGGTVNFVMRPKSQGIGVAPKVNAAAVLVTPASGIVRYDWAAGDTDTVGLFHVEWIFTLAGISKTCPNGSHNTAEIYESLV